MSETVAKDHAIYITYSILNQQGEVMEQSEMPSGYVQGADSGLLEPIEAALEGAKVGDQVEVTLPPETGFGAYDPNLTFTDDVENVPPEYRFVGAEVEFQNENGERQTFRVSKIENGKLTVDANHPYAGQTVKFVVTVLHVRPATAEEIATGRPDEGGTPTSIH